jgi:hypothetical protein
MAGIQDLIQSYAYGGPVRRYAAGDIVSSTPPPPQPAFSSDPTINAQWNALAGKTGADITAQRQALAQQNAVYQTNQNLGSLYGITQAPAQNQFLTDFNTAAGIDPTTSANILKGMSDPTTMASMNKEIAENPNNFQYLAPTGNAYAPSASQTFEQALATANAASPGKGAGNALMNQFTTGAGAADNPFLDQYNQANAAAGTSITPFTAQQLYNQQHPAVASPAAANAVGGYFDPNQFRSVSESVDSEGYQIKVTPLGTFKVNPVNHKIVSVIPVAKAASGGTVGMPQEYSQGNWKLI